MKRFQNLLVLSACFLAAWVPATCFAQDDVLTKIQAKAESAAVALAETRKEIDLEKIPLLEQLEQLQDEMVEVQRTYEEVLRKRDLRTLDVSNTKAKIANREKQNEFLLGEFDKFASEFSRFLHVSEAQRYREQLDAANLAAKADLDLADAFNGRIDLLELAAERTADVAGGSVFPGRATDTDGVLKPGTFVLVGPRAYFVADDSSPGHTGLAEEKISAIEPNVIPETPPELKPAIEQFVAAGAGQGVLPVDVTEGEALTAAKVDESVVDEIKKGGLVMWPLMGLGAISVIIALVKYFGFLSVKRVSARRLREVFEALDKEDPEAASEKVNRTTGPIGRMLRVGIEHYKDPPVFIEEVLYESQLKAKQKLNAFIPVIKITAAAAPLLGLLGTVSGMINTFKLITIYGTGDASTFSAGISEALITTKWGLIVAIPCLLISAFLARKSRGIIDDMEKISLAFVNHFRNDDDDLPFRPEPGPDDDGGESLPVLAAS